MSGRKREERKKLAEKKIEIIKQFATDMGYETWEEDYTTSACFRDGGRPAHSIELDGKYDCEGNPYCWAWYTDTWEEMT